MAMHYPSGDLDWLYPVMAYIDFTYSIFHEELVGIGYITKGIYSYEVLRDMPFTEYEIVNKKVMEFVKRSPGEQA